MRVDRGAHVVHPHPPRSVQPGERGDHRGGRLPAVRWARFAVGTRQQACRGTACVTRRPGPGTPVPTNSGSARSSAQLCSAVLAKPSPGSMITLAGSTPAAHRRVHAGHQFVAHLGDDVAVGRRVVRAGRADGAPVHQHPRHLRVGEQRRHVRVGAATGHVVDDPGAVLQRGPRHLGVHGVDADRKPLPGKLFDHRQHP